MGELPQDQMEFLKREYEIVVEKIAHSRSEVGRVETLYPVAIVAIYAWLMKFPPVILSMWYVATIIPIGLVALGLVRLFARYRMVARLEEYIGEIEAQMFGETSWGWERRYAKAKPLRGLRLVRFALGIAILIGTIFMFSQTETYFREWQRVEAQRHSSSQS